MRLFRAPTRVFAVIRKELIELVRRPGAVLSLIFGPLLIMGLFGLGFSGARRPFDAIVVLPAASELPRDPAFYQRVSRSALTIVSVTEDVEAARGRLDSGTVAMLVIAPADARQRLERGEHATVRVELNQLDPVADAIARSVADIIAYEMSAELIAAVAREGLGRPEAAVVVARSTAPETVARPVKAEVQNRAPVRPSLLTFFAPAVLALVLQHLGITMTALSMVRERGSGAIDILRVAPISTIELLLGKYIAYAITSLVVAALVLVVTTNLLQIPFLGDTLELATLVVLLTFAALGTGLLISLWSDSERQAVQLATLVLLLSVFFSGFVIPVSELRMPVQALAYALPVTYAIPAFQQEMLRGQLPDATALAAMAAIGALLFILSAARLRQVLRRAA
ncbi:MAG TPA: ABC transporter permease [Candidatus Limnocylindria bacterium]|nr:ABC transporter permease [Candidatus Limnocylindria bacterium]